MPVIDSLMNIAEDLFQYKAWTRARMYVQDVRLQTPKHLSLEQMLEFQLLGTGPSYP